MAENTNKKSVKKPGCREIFTRNLNLAVGKLGWSQTEFGRRLKLKSQQSGARRFLKGEVNITFDGFDKIEEALGIPIAQLFEADGAGLDINVESAETLRTAREMLQKLGPVLSKLNPGGVDPKSLSIAHAPQEKFADFINKFHRGRGVTAHFLDLLNRKTKDEILNVEYLREVAVTVLSEGGVQAKNARKVLIELLEKEQDQK